MTFVAPVPLLVHVGWGWASAAFIVGYILQFAGHAVEGNDAGEVILVKKTLGMPYIDVIDPPNQSSSDV